MRLVLVLVGLSVLCVCFAAKKSESVKSAKSTKTTNLAGAGRLTKRLGSIRQSVINRIKSHGKPVVEEDPEGPDTDNAMIFLHGVDQGGPDLCVGPAGKQVFGLSGSFKSHRNSWTPPPENPKSDPKRFLPDPHDDLSCKCSTHCSRVFGYNFVSPGEFNFSEGIVIPLTSGEIIHSPKSPNLAKFRKSRTQENAPLTCGCETTEEFISFLSELGIDIKDFEAEKSKNTDVAIKNVYEQIHAVWPEKKGENHHVQHLAHDALLNYISEEMESHDECISQVDPLRSQADLNACIAQEWGWGKPQNVETFTRMVFNSPKLV